MRMFKDIRVAMLALGAFAVVATLVLAPPALAQGDEKTEMSTDKEGKPSESEQAVADLDLAARLADYGAKHKDPLALLAAARIFKSTPTQKVEGKSGLMKDDKAGESKDSTATPADADSCLANARKLSGDDASLKALADTIASEKARGAYGGPRRGRYRLPGRRTWFVNVTFKAGRRARIAIAGCGTSDLDLYVYSMSGRLLIREVSRGDRCWVAFTPRYDLTVQIQVKNLGIFTNTFVVGYN